MRSSSAITALVLASASALTAASPLENLQVPLRGAVTAGPVVPGSSPARYCDENYADDLLDLKYINLTPKEPQRGENVTIEAEGTLKQEVSEGSYIVFTVKLGPVQLLKETVDFCEQVGQVDLECPVKKGEKKIVKEFQLPDEIPPGKYTLKAEAFNEDEDRIVCLTADVAFKL